MNKEPPFVIIRRPNPGARNQAVRYLGQGYGWTTNPQMARYFPTALRARALLNNRPGEIVPADFITTEARSGNALGEPPARENQKL